MVRNPWLDLHGRFVLPEDQTILLRDKRFFEDKFKLQLQLPPVPFINNPEIANVIVLAKNPGYAPTNDAELEHYPDFVEQNLAALSFESDCPFFYLDARFEGADGYVWWNKVLADVFRVCYEQCEISRQDVVKRIACVQWYPYHSKRFMQPLEPLHSQAFSFNLVAQAATQEKLFIILWGAENERLWRTSVPNLPEDCIRLNSQQMPRLSRGNMRTQDFSRLIQTLCLQAAQQGAAPMRAGRPGLQAGG